MGLNTIGMSNKSKKAGYYINNAILKDPSRIFKECDKLPYDGYVQKRPKHEPTDSNFYLAIHIYKCLMRSDTFNLHVYSVRTEMTSIQKIPIS